VSATHAAAAALLGALMVSAAPAIAQQVGSANSPATRRPTLNLEPPSADLASPPAAGPRLAAGPGRSGDCAPAWPCRLRLFGFTGKYGGIGLKGPALTW
jgi:hypothetical protein